MMGDALSLVALGLLAAALVAALGAVASRSLFVACMYLAATGAAVATAVALLGAGNGALAVSLIAAGWAPVLLLAAVLLSARAAKGAGQRFPWVSLVIAAGAVVAVWWPLSELSAQSLAETQAPINVAFWLAPLALAAAIGTAAILGYGERGALSNGDSA